LGQAACGPQVGHDCLKTLSTQIRHQEVTNISLWLAVRTTQVNRAGIIQGGSCLPLPVLRTSPGTTAAAILLHGKQKQKQKQKEDG